MLHPWSLKVFVGSISCPFIAIFAFLVDLPFIANIFSLLQAISKQLSKRISVWEIPSGLILSEGQIPTYTPKRETVSSVLDG